MMVVSKIKGIKMYGKNIIWTLSTVACMGLMTACGGGGSGGGSGGGAGSHASSAIAQKTFIAIIRNHSEETCRVHIAIVADLGAFVDPIASVESNSISCEDYGRVDNTECKVITQTPDPDNTIACVTGHDGLIP